MKLHAISLGCQMNVADSEEMARPLLARGFALTPDLDDADAVILNTCTVRQHAEDRALSLLGRLKPWKDARPERFLIVAGCAAERLGDWLRRRFPHVDLVAGARSIERYPELLDAALRARFDWSAENAGAWDGPPAASPSTASAFVTIMRGCNYSCSYCIVPAVRGRESYRPPATILDEARARTREGALEITLLGQTVNSYRHGETDFADLLREVAGVPGVERIRFMSPHPYFLDERLIAAYAELPQVAPHLHMPVQSGSDRLLRAMRRNYTRASYLERTSALRARVPDLTLTTDFIAGFPGETAEDFAATLSLIAEADFAAAYCFKYSARQGTAAAALPDRLPEALIEERHARLLEEMESRARRRLESMRGRRVRVLLETETEGRSQYYFRARLSEPGRPGTMVDAVVTGETRTGLTARPLTPCLGQAS